MEIMDTTISRICRSFGDTSNLLYFLPVLPLAGVILLQLVHILFVQFCTDIPSIPSPPLPLWKRYTIGINPLSLAFGETAVKAAARFNRWRDTYGPIYVLYGYFGKPMVIATSETALRTINITKHLIYHKTKVMRTSFATLIGHDGILLAEGDKHAALRAAVAPALHHDALVAVSHIFLREGTRLADNFSNASPDTGLHALQFVREGTFNVIIETCFGSGVVPADIARHLQDAYLESFLEPPKHMFRRNLLQTFLWFLPKRWFGFREDLRACIRMTVAQLCKDRPAARADRKPLLQLMEENARAPLARSELVDTVLSFLTAGQATTSIAVCWLLYELACAPKWQQCVVKELEENWTESDGLDKLDQLPVLSRVVHECLRLYPPVFYEARQLAQSDELDGYRLPKGTVVRVPILALHRNRSIWGEDADRFDPDRHLNGSVLQKRTFWMTFLHGPRSCIGSRFAILEIKAFAAQVLLRHEVSVRTEQDGEPKVFGVFATPQGMKLYFRRRHEE